MKTFDLRFLDHVAIRVKDPEHSASWYEKVLGLKRLNIAEWGNFPVFMSCGKTGVAIFPAKLTDPEIDKQSKNVAISHFAFNVSNENFKKAQEHYRSLKIEFEFQDHHYFHSIYTKDPDGHMVELTTIVVEEDSFYKE
jgi:catechol 2,3-dioxygenase-like lactoylglutathione lyase family enzyme